MDRMIAEGPRGCGDQERLLRAIAAGAYRQAGDTGRSSGTVRTDDPRSRAGVRTGEEVTGGHGVRVPVDSVELTTTSPVRAEKVAQVRARIAEGYYERDEIKEALSRRLLEQFGAE